MPVEQFPPHISQLLHAIKHEAEEELRADELRRRQITLDVFYNPPGSTAKPALKSVGVAVHFPSKQRVPQMPIDKFTPLSAAVRAARAV